MAGGESSSGGAALLKGLAAVFAVLVVASVGYAVWIIVRYWGNVGV